MYRDSGPLTQDEIDNIKNFMYSLGYRDKGEKGDVSFSLPYSSSLNVFTERQLQIFQMFSNGHTQKEIAVLLHIHSTTLKRDIGDVYSVLDVEERCHAVAKFIRMGLIQ